MNKLYLGSLEDLKVELNQISINFTQNVCAAFFILSNIFKNISIRNNNN